MYFENNSVDFSKQLGDFESKCRSLRLQGFQIGDQDALNQRLYSACKTVDPITAIEKLIRELQTRPRVSPQQSSAVREMQRAINDATGRSFSDSEMTEAAVLAAMGQCR